MISEIARRHGVIYRGVLHMPINTCSHCGYEDDPETAQHWSEDADGDRICPPCAEPNGPPQ